MKAYRCYLLDYRSRISGVEVIECSGDDEAKHAAEALLKRQGHRAGELWDGRRLVARLGLVVPLGG